MRAAILPAGRAPGRWARRAPRPRSGSTAPCWTTARAPTRAPPARGSRGWARPPARRASATCGLCIMDRVTAATVVLRLPGGAAQDRQPRVLWKPRVGLGHAAEPERRALGRRDLLRVR